MPLLIIYLLQKIISIMLTIPPWKAELMSRKRLDKAKTELVSLFDWIHILSS